MMTDAFPSWESFFSNFVATWGLRLPEVAGLDPQPGAMAIRPCHSACVKKVKIWHVC